MANTAVTILSADFVRFAVVHADDSWAYLYAVLKRELAGQAGRFFRADPEHIPSARDLYLWDIPTVPISQAIELTLDRLKSVTELSWHAPLRESVFYFVERGHGRLSHLFTNSTRAVELTGLGLSRVQILAIGNVVLGSRPHHGTNSILGGFLRDENWDPSVSLPHRRALSKFALRINSNLDIPTRTPTWAS
ncbi:MAG: hypothetical protein H7248_01515 [Microbacteriaceae bacterium]|nr:hypothetical protein [Microbacteriaceae bacterium]